MDRRGDFAAAILDASARALAARAVERQREISAGTAERELCASGDCWAESEQRLRYLAEGVALETPAIFRVHVDWTRATHAARGLPSTYLSNNLACLREVLQQDLPGDVWTAARPSLEDALASLGTPMPPLASSLLTPADSSRAHTELARRFLLALLEGRKRDALALVLTAAESGTSIPDLHQNVLARVQAEIGWMWQAGEVHVGEEHLGTRIIEEALVLLRARLPRRDPIGHSVLVASVEGNLHEVGARIVADRFELEGWTVHFLGANVPTPDLVRSLEDVSADVLALSVELGISARAAARAVAAVRAIRGRRIPILVGGLLFDSVPGLWKTVGADAHARDLDEAVRTAERLLVRN